MKSVNAAEFTKLRVLTARQPSRPVLRAFNLLTWSAWIPSPPTPRTQPFSTSQLKMAHTPPQYHIIHAPSAESPHGKSSIFLAGTTSKVDSTDWREALSASLSDYPVTIYDPYRADWDGSWREDIDFAPFREQVEWELDRLERADVVVVYFHPATQAPITLLELGLFARVPGKAIVVCPEGYWKRGNVQIVCKRFGVEMLDGLDGLREMIMKRLHVGS